MKKILFTLVSIATLTSAGFASLESKSENAISLEKAGAVPAHLNESIYFLNTYKVNLGKELIEEIKEGGTLESIMKVAANYQGISDVMVLIQAIQGVHGDADIHENLDMKKVADNKKGIAENLEQKHLAETIHFLNAYHERLQKELQEDVKKDENFENILEIINNIHKIEKGVQFLNSILLIHNHDILLESEAK